MSPSPRDPTVAGSPVDIIFGPCVGGTCPAVGLWDGGCDGESEVAIFNFTFSMIPKTNTNQQINFDGLDGIICQSSIMNH